MAESESSKPRRSFATKMNRALLITILVLFGCQASLNTAQQAQSSPNGQSSVAQQFPDGPGKDVFLRICSNCHAPTNVMANRQNRDGWEDTITKMVAYGATGSDGDFTAVLDYLEKNFGPLPKVNINKADAAQLEKGLQLEQPTAEAIITYRDKHGDFKTLDDVKQVPGVDAAVIDAKKTLITFE